MRKSALLYNPESGGSKQRQRQLNSALSILRDGGIEAELFPTESPEHAVSKPDRPFPTGATLSSLAVATDRPQHRPDLGLRHPQVALGVLPMGTANALAHDLRIPFGIPAAAKVAMHASTRRIALGRILYHDMQGNPCTRYFVIAAGMGVDAHLFYKLHTGLKQRLGMRAYYAKAWHMWFTYPMTRFGVKYQESGSEEEKNALVTELLAVRIRHFGGVIQSSPPVRRSTGMICGSSSAIRAAALPISRTSRGAWLAPPGRFRGLNWRVVPGHGAIIRCDRNPSRSPECTLRPMGN